MNAVSDKDAVIHMDDDDADYMQGGEDEVGLDPFTPAASSLQSIGLRL